MSRMSRKWIKNESEWIEMNSKWIEMTKKNENKYFVNKQAEWWKIIWIFFINCIYVINVFVFEKKRFEIFVINWGFFVWFLNDCMHVTFFVLSFNLISFLQKCFFLLQFIFVFFSLFHFFSTCFAYSFNLFRVDSIGYSYIFLNVKINI